jgi:hypothetical protein
MFKLYETIYDKLGDWILDWDITVDALRRSYTESDICEAGYHINIKMIEHLSWQQNNLSEINEILHKIYHRKLKPNQYPSEDNYYTWLMECTDKLSPEEISFVERFNMHYESDKERTNLSDAEVFDIIKEIIRKISIDMANRKYKHIRDYI